MTVVTKASDMGRKPDLIEAPLVETHYDSPNTPQGRVSPRRRPRIRHVLVYRQRYCQPCLTCISVTILTFVLTSAIVGLIYYTVFRSSVRFRGYCAIPIDVPRDIRLQKLRESRKLPLVWSEEPEDMSVYTTLDENATGDALNKLLERFEIDDYVEKVSIFNDGNNVEFIHNFNTNVTGIVDKKRCFTMDLDPETVLKPGVFVYSIHNGDPFDVRRVRTDLSAVVPPVPRLLASVSTVYAELCGGKPAYKLKKSESGIRRKRSPDEPQHEYIHFAGNQVQEIAIDNLDEVLEYEKKLAA